MPDYSYFCVTLKGEYLRGEYTSKDSHELARELWEHGLFLIWWDSISPDSDIAIARQELAPALITGQDLVMLWKKIWSSERTPDFPEKWPFPKPQSGLIGWVMANTWGAVTTRSQAIFVIGLVSLLLAGTLFNSARSFIPQHHHHPLPGHNKLHTAVRRVPGH